MKLYRIAVQPLILRERRRSYRPLADEPWKTSRSMRPPIVAVKGARNRAITRRQARLWEKNESRGRRKRLANVARFVPAGLRRPTGRPRGGNVLDVARERLAGGVRSGPAT